MEEDIKILKEILTEPRFYFNEKLTFEAMQIKLQAIENILGRLEQLEKENKELKESNEIVETNYDTLRGDIQAVVNELGFPEDTIISDEFVLMIKENYIPKSVIREKIDKLKREFDFFAGREHHEWQDGEFDGEQCDDLALQIRVLKEILGEE